MGFGSDAWDRLFGSPRPAELHPFREIRSRARHAVSTPGDLVFHIRAKRMDLCFELATQILARLEGAVTTADEVHGFRYFDDRDLLGFVDGTENPTASAAADAVFIGEEDPAFTGGSYVIVQKYLHNLDAWNRLPTEAQEKIIGRKKVSDIELDDSVKPTCAHNALTVIEEDGRKIKILGDNMPFGRPGHGEFGTYFIGYSRSPRTIEQMLENMFIGRPPGNFASSTSARRLRGACSSSRPPRSLTASPPSNSLKLHLPAQRSSRRPRRRLKLRPPPRHPRMVHLA
jgi:putative iron-dependent peroxidase